MKKEKQFWKIMLLNIITLGFYGGGEAMKTLEGAGLLETKKESKR